MREIIRQALIDGVPEVEGRVFEPWVATADTEKPYLVVRETAESDNVEWAGFRGRIEVWPYVELESLSVVDSLAKEINEALHMKFLADGEGEAITCIADGMGEDISDMDWDALTRCVSFYTLAIQPTETRGTADNDPWVDALVSWTQDLLGKGYEVYGGKIPGTYQRPAVLWRLDNLEITDAGAYAFDVQKKVACHVFGRNAVEETNIAVLISEHMGSQYKIPLKIAERRFMTLQDLNVSLYTDSMKQGHLRAILSRKTQKPQEEVALIQGFSSQGILNRKGDHDNGR
ncbi:hypothetical protein [Selenomonas ruminantium]|uniref:Uncharacterized protein n=1 Tax=Selenomonas ruminantium TaxID=971 RepID=A0A1H0N1C7_SELRU|nr:hypothetical protein [Selenomonas ruminantium]SDO86504.1 hypothetical protein SAMN05216366_102132 [Selenomonas ruminantium]